MKITIEIFHVGGHRLTSPEDAAIYLINFAGHAVLVDAGCGDAQDRLKPNILSCGVNLEQSNTYSSPIAIMTIRGVSKP